MASRHEFQLRPVKGALARVQRRFQLRRLAGIGQRRLGAVPNIVLAGPDFRTVGEFHPHVLEAEIGVDRLQKFAEPDRFRRDLVLGAEDMRVVLREGPHPHDAVERARRLVAVAGAELGHAKRQVAVGFDPLPEDLDMAGAVHRLQRQRPVVLRLGGEHVLAELVPVAGGFPQRAVDELRGFNLGIAAFLEPPAHIGLDLAIDGPAIRMPEHRSGRLFLQMEEVELPAELAMVALFRLLEHVEIGVQFLSVRQAVP